MCTTILVYHSLGDLISFFLVSIQEFTHSPYRVCESERSGSEYGVRLYLQFAPPVLPNPPPSSPPLLLSPFFYVFVGRSADYKLYRATRQGSRVLCRPARAARPRGGAQAGAGNHPRSGAGRGGHAREGPSATPCERGCLDISPRLAAPKAACGTHRQEKNGHAYNRGLNLQPPANLE